jgi:phosphatidylserine decarboxylase
LSNEAVTYFNRHTGKLETEAIYGEDSLRWVYGSPLGRLSLHLLVKRAIFSKLYGWLMDKPSSKAKVQPFIEKYGLDEAEFERPASEFATFNEFFSRKLQPEARPIDKGLGTVVFPADGRHLLVKSDSDFIIKGQRFNVEELIGQRAGDCDVLISRLCPTDYHRFHFPCSGQAGKPQRIRGPFYSVNPIALAIRPSILWENERFVTQLTTLTGLSVSFVEVGATCVGKVVHTSEPGLVEKGQEKGTFLFGGSTVIWVVPSGSVKWADDVERESALGRELYARMGAVAGAWHG